ncbi:complex I NDUFA9 subunit family protein [Paracoccus methylarcula]|uniref:Complex I NDUFA9 subunit family protein n=1 Tax=Paracoccus methylarcula TaxID=72022 RepID=A0A3R7LJ43_9RHOB|nr:complex I NDUFA9 subunit family protein [Paracoccus methylarcula]RNF33705.1 complex I NDUFA9 subunit family protein [Paracoccus methylarcula]
MAKLVTIFGGSGFLGRQVARLMAKRGWRVRIAVRRPNEALFTRTYGAVGQVVPVLCNIRDEESVRAAMSGADAVVNCVNITSKQGKSTFKSIFEDGARNIARLSQEMGIAQVVHISGLGVDAASSSKYVAAKARGEAAVIENRPDAVVLRPSVLFGTGDSFYNRFASLARFGPIMPVIGSRTRMQPAHVDDVALAAVIAAEGQVASGIYELGGPDMLTVREIVEQVLKVTYRRRLVLNMPFWLARIGAGILDAAQYLTGGLFTNRLLNGDQLALLRQDNIVGEDARGFAAFGIQPSAPEAVIEDYLWRFRPSGQYDDIKQSAKNLRIS